MTSRRRSCDTWSSGPPRRRRTCRTSPGTSRPCRPRTCAGLPEMQTQHTCILLADLTDSCNLRCPTCFTDSSPAIEGVVPLADILAGVDTKLSRENGRIDVLMLSGGEPTLYPHLPELLREVSARNVVRVLINSNGVRIARDDALLDLLTEHRERVEVYLQYDGVSERAARHHRGADLTPPQRSGDRPALRPGHLHHPDDDLRTGRQRRRDRRRREAGPGHPVCRRRVVAAAVRLRSFRRDRPARSAHPHRRPGPPRPADRRTRSPGAT